MNAPKTICITGGTVGGLGHLAAQQLLAQNRDHTIILTVRTREKGEQALAALREATTHVNLKVSYFLCDFASFAGVRSFIDAIKKSHTHLDVLVCNAAVLLYNYQLTPDGHEEQYQVNYLSNFLIINSLLPMLTKDTPSRIVVLSSEMHEYAKHLDPSYLHTTITPSSPYSGLDVYAHTKCLLSMLVLYLSTRLPQNITINLVTPGLVPVTGMLQNGSVFNRWFHRYIVWWLPIAVTPEKGAAKIVQVAVGEEAATSNGAYWDRGQPKKPRIECYDAASQIRNWNLSCELTGLAHLKVQDH
ncbi:hypothetical protein HK104_005237 [Borealophlyctis nickersoniae]|nr:hypothetical protein HK104_005237 [Borealophlyctis nickersoniae]